MCGAEGGPRPQGDTGPQGPVGTFSNTTDSPVTFDGGATINGALTINGTDLLAASMAGLAPAVFGYPFGFGPGHLSCGAPATLDVGATVGINSATYGEVIYTTQGIFNLSQRGPSFMGCSNPCAGPLTFFLNSPRAQTIVLQGYFDDGPSKIYVDGAVQATVAETFNQGVDVPEGPFALSLVACSAGDSTEVTIGMYLSNRFIPTYNLSVDVDRTFHRNGK
jgi:hypothetical protein